VAGLSAWLVRLLGGRKDGASHRVRWDQMDLSDPEHPRLTCAADELAPIDEEPPPRAEKRHP
jgi:hypothetical protein